MYSKYKIYIAADNQVSMQQEHVHFSKNTLSQLDNYYGMYYNLFNISFHQNGKPTFLYNDDDHHHPSCTC